MKNGVLNNYALAFVLSGLLFNCSSTHDTEYNGWPAYAGSPSGIRYSSNEQINTSNVSQLEVAWTFSTKDKDSLTQRTQNQCNPIVINGILYGTSPRLKLFALNAAIGAVQWIFDPATVDTTSVHDPMAFFKVGRGVMYWQDEHGANQRIFYSAGARTYAVNAVDGTLLTGFGNGGFIDLSENLGREAGTFNSFVASTTPGIIYRDLLIMGTRVAESADAAPGHIRAYDVRTGVLRWVFHTIPQPGEFGYETWEDREAWKKLGGANNWAGMALDEERGIVYIPTGSVSGDFYGGIRKGANLFGNSLIALDAATGKYIWHYQVVHHDLWDRDLPANPNLVTIKIDGRSIDAVAQITKQGFIFLFDRTNGHPVFPIEEKPVPASDLPGEEAWPTQPVPTLPERFSRSEFGLSDISDIFPESREELLSKFNEIKYHQMYTPPSKEGVWIFPGFDGGGEWGGAAVDPQSGILYVNSSELPWSLKMVDVPGRNGTGGSVKNMGQSVYGKYCLSCHGPELKGNGESFPSLADIGKRSAPGEVVQLVKTGRNMMPGFSQISPAEMDALLDFLFHSGENRATAAQDKEPEANRPTYKSVLDEVPYTMTGYNRFLDSRGYPGITPPWGTLNAVDLNTGKLLWKVPLGEYAELTARGIAPTGTENYGGPVVTKGGLVFIAATKDEKIRAFDKVTGSILWEAPLPAAGYATPATYFVAGKQYVVIACGGGKIGSKSGDSYVAFALPDDHL